MKVNIVIALPDMPINEEKLLTTTYYVEKNDDITTTFTIHHFTDPSIAQTQRMIEAKLLTQISKRTSH